MTLTSGRCQVSSTSSDKGRELTKGSSKLAQLGLLAQANVLMGPAQDGWPQGKVSLPKSTQTVSDIKQWQEGIVNLNKYHSPKSELTQIIVVQVTHLI